MTLGVGGRVLLYLEPLGVVVQRDDAVVALIRLGVLVSQPYNVFVVVAEGFVRGVRSRLQVQKMCGRAAVQ